MFAEPRLADLLGVLALVDDVFVAHGRMELVWTVVIKCVVLLLHVAVLVGHPRTCATLRHLTLEQRLKVYNWGACLLAQGACIQSVRGHLVHGVLRRAAQGAIKAVDSKARQVTITARAWRLCLIPPKVEPLALGCEEGRLFTRHAFGFRRISARSRDLSKLAIFRLEEAIRPAVQSCCRPELML